MQTIKITTPQNIDIDYEVAGVGERFVARLIDIGLYILVLLLVLLITGLSGNRINSTLTIVLAVVVIALLYVFYDLFCEMLMNGQSIGKKVMKIKVVSLDGTRPSFSQYLLRWIFRIVDFTLTLQVCGLISVAISEKQQRVGDMVAGTTLIRTRPRTLIEHIGFRPVVNEYDPIFKEVAQLKDSDIAVVQEIIRTYMQTGNSVLVYSGATRLKELLSLSKPAGMDDLVFLQTIVKDYTYLNSVNGVQINN